MALTAGDIVIATDDTHIETTDALVKTYRQVFTFNNAALIASHTTPLTLVSAPGANKLVVFQGADVVTNFTTPYSNISASGHTYIAYNSSPVIAASIDIRNDAGESLTWHDYFWEQAGAGTPLYWQLQPNFGLFNETFGSAMPYESYDTSIVYNKGLIMKVSNSANFTGGHANNTLKIAVKWDVWDLS